MSETTLLATYAKMGARADKDYEMAQKSPYFVQHCRCESFSTVRGTEERGECF